MARLIAVAAGIVVAGGCLTGGTVSAWEPSARMWPKKFMGRDYWTILTKDYYTSKIDPMAQEVDPKPPLNPKLRALPAFQDTGIYYSFGRNPPKGGKATWRTMRENFASLDKRDDKAWESFRPKNDGRPALCVVQHHRRMNSLEGEIDLDYADYAAFTNGLPNLLGYSMLSEWVNDARSVSGRCARMSKTDPERAELVRRNWGEETKGRFSSIEFLKRFWDRRLATYYNDYAHCIPLSSCARIDHLQCVWGAHALTIETSGTTGQFMEYRWDASTMITRGAARQFDMPWNWYIAQYSCGFTHDTHKWVTDSRSSALPGGIKDAENGRPWLGPNGGLSPSIMRRALYMSYLVGANFTQPEYTGSFKYVDPATGRHALTRFGKDWVEFSDFTRAHPGRGALVTPVALLAPVKQFYTSFGGMGSPGGHMVDGAMFTLCPGVDRGEYVRRGGEGHLHASKFPQFVDYLVADAPQRRGEYLDALSCYRAAILVGNHDKDVDIAGPLHDYVKNGGCLVVNAVYLGRAGFGPDFTGVAWDGEKKFAGEAKHEVATLAVEGAKVLEADAEGRPLMTSFRYGKGGVIVTAALYMTPKYDDKRSVGETIPGRLKFPWFDKVFTMLQKRLYPIALKEGKVLWGLNRTKTGWWVWALNNQGVTKYPDTAEVVDASAAETVTVDVSKLKPARATDIVSGRPVSLRDDGTMSFTVPAGDLAVVELE